MADVEPAKTAVNGPAAGGGHRLKATSKRNPGSADPKNKSRLAALAPGENLKERQVCRLWIYAFVIKLWKGC